MNLNNLDTQDQALVTMYVELAEIGRKMRAEQRNFFATNLTVHLQASKKLEKKFDVLLGKILITKNQTVLFT